MGKSNVIRIWVYIASFFIIINCGGPKPVVSKVQIFENVSDEVSESNYLSGEKFCQKYIFSQKDNPQTVEAIRNEDGFFVDVPLDYNQPQSEKMKIYAYFKKAYNPLLPTMVFFDGGPGQTTHFLYHFVKNFNQLHFDQRGLGCSAPKNFSTYKNSDIYSSLNNARDLHEIIKFKNISKVSVYGVSYGTVPATIFANIYPDKVVSLNLEGVIYSSDYLFSTDLIRNKLQRLYDSLSVDTQIGLDKISQKNPQFFPNFVRNYFYQDEGLTNAKMALELSITKDGKYDPLFNREGKKKNNKFPQNLENIDRQVYSALFCKELDKISFKYELVLIQGKVERLDNSKVANMYCYDYLKIQKNMENSYSAEHYPVQKPVYYFQGVDDGATVASGAIMHWRKAATNSAYLMIKKTGGHNPNLASIFSKNSAESLAQQKLFLKGLVSASITEVDLKEVNYSQNRLFFNEWLLFTDKISQFSDAEKNVVKVLNAK